jgi:light-regulated signal transduction histidine kinase (bacteriophytochrome)
MADVQVQSAGFLLELSPDWLILRASENIHRFFGTYHATLVGEPLADFTMAQPLHDLRNRLSRQRSASGIARAYRVRLIDQPRHFDLAFQLLDGRILLEGVMSVEDGHGGALGAVSRLIEGLGGGNLEATMNSAARRMRALTGYDRVALSLGDAQVISSRGEYPDLPSTVALPAILVDTSQKPVALFQRDMAGSEAGQALLSSPTDAQLQLLREQGVASVLKIPVLQDGEPIGHFICDNRTPREADIELHAAAELFAQIFALHLD